MYVFFFFVICFLKFFLFLNAGEEQKGQTRESFVAGWLAGLYSKGKKNNATIHLSHSVCKRQNCRRRWSERSRDFTHLPIYLGGVMSISWLFVLLFIFWRFCFIAEFRRSQWRVTDWLIEICLFFPSPKFRIWNKCKQLRKRVILPVVLFCFSGVDELQASKEKTFFVCFDI